LVGAQKVVTIVAEGQRVSRFWGDTGIQSHGGKVSTLPTGKNTSLLVSIPRLEAGLYRTSRKAEQSTLVDALIHA
jgi:hypothetical protein